MQLCASWETKQAIKQQLEARVTRTSPAPKEALHVALITPATGHSLVFMFRYHKQQSTKQGQRVNKTVFYLHRYSPALHGREAEAHALIPAVACGLLRVGSRQVSPHDECNEVS